MRRLEWPSSRNASLHRRGLLAAGIAVALTGCAEKSTTTVSTTPPLDGAKLDEAIGRIAARARPATLGVGLMNLENGESFLFNGDHPFPMQSVFKAPLGAAVLAEVDAGHLSLDEPFVLQEHQLSPQHSPISAAWPARRDFRAGELLEAAVSGSDNTAADVLMKRIGGPGAVTAWLDARRAAGIRIDRYERELQTDIYGMGSFRPQWRTSAAFGAARAAVAPARREAAMRAYLTDARDTASPQGMLEFLGMLHRRELISPGATQTLLSIMTRTPSAPGRLKAGLPADARIAHKSGTSGTDLGLTPTVNDVGIFTLADGRAYAIAAFLAGTTLAEAARDGLIADVAEAAVRAAG